MGASSTIARVEEAAVAVNVGVVNSVCPLQFGKQGQLVTVRQNVLVAFKHGILSLHPKRRKTGEGSLLFRPTILETGTGLAESGIISLVLAERLLELTINLLRT